MLRKLMHSRPTTILSIAGSDNTSGAGIQADIKISKSLGAYCLTALTCVTSQNSDNIINVFNVPSNIVESQINVSLKEYKVDGIKIGLITSLKTVKKICKSLKSYSKKIPIVVDPVYRSTNNRYFNKKNEYLKTSKELSKLNPFFTPNIFEASILSNMKLNPKVSIEDILKNLGKIYRCNFVITGVEKKKNYYEDYLFFQKEIKTIRSKRISSSSTHGTGCAFSTALTIYLAKGSNFFEACKKAKSTINKKLKSSPRLGVKYGPLI